MECSSGPGAKIAIPRLRRPDQQTIPPKPPHIRPETVNKAVSTLLPMSPHHDAKQRFSAIDVGSAVGIISNPVFATVPTSCFVWTYCAS